MADAGFILEPVGLPGLDIPRPPNRKGFPPGVWCKKFESQLTPDDFDNRFMVEVFFKNSQGIHVAISFGVRGNESIEDACSKCFAKLRVAQNLGPSEVSSVFRTVKITPS